jgi:hypothetical protein
VLMVVLVGVRRHDPSVEDGSTLPLPRLSELRRRRFA